MWQRLEYTQIPDLEDQPWANEWTLGHEKDEPVDEDELVPAMKRQRRTFAGCAVACFVLGVTAASFHSAPVGTTTARYRSALASREAQFAAKSMVRPSMRTDMLNFWSLNADPSTLPLQVRRWMAQPVDQSWTADSEQLALGGGAQLNVTLTNSYTVKNPVELGEYSNPWSYVAEPYRVTTMRVATPRDDAVYKWVVEGHVQGFGVECEVVFMRTGYHNVVLVELENADIEDVLVPATAALSSRGSESTGVLAMRVMSKYARREIRSLTDYDREKFFNAVQVMAVVPTTVGQALFGDKYRSKDVFTRTHLYYGGSKDCDKWHQGAGFVTSHVALTLEFEQSLQAVFPDVSMPYWDFTLESTFFRASDFRESTVFAPSWFGEASPDNELHTVVEGRWAFTPTMTMARNFSRVVNSYGLLRSPWNNDPTPFMTRHDHVYGYENNLKPSGCFEYHNALRKDTWMSFSKQLNSAAHGHLHETMGGSWNHAFTETTHRSVAPAILSYSHEIQALSKNLWRAGFVTCPDSCDMDVSWMDCECACDASAISGMPAWEVLDAAGVLQAVSYYDAHDRVIESFYDDNGTIYLTLPDHSYAETQHVYQDMLESLCSPGHIGDMFQATSSNDITFWVLHGTLDRLWHFKRLGDTSNFDETWDAYHPCDNHNPAAFQPFKNLFDEADSYYTNEQLYTLLDPRGTHMPYLYDNFQWPHCDLVGFSMENHH